MMESRHQISLAIQRWAAWTPGLTTPAEWRSWAEGAREIGGLDPPDVSFVAPLMRRRLSSLSRMAFRAAADCLDETNDVAYVFCSRYGEYHRSFGILTDLAQGSPASAAAFSTSVHNTAASLFAIENKHTSSAISVAGGDATLETGFIEAWSQLASNAANAILLVCHDEPLPPLYSEQRTTIYHPAAIAMLLRSAREGDSSDILHLRWDSSVTDSAPPAPPADPALSVLKSLLTNGGTVEIDSGRLVWTWSATLGAD
jgi:hypothetical protein